MAAYNYQPAEITDFSKGVTDDYVNGPLNACATLDNFYILNNKSIKTRPGTLVDSETDPQIPLGTQRVQTLMSYNNGDKLFVHSGTKIYYRNPVNYSSLLGPTSNNPFSLADANTYLAHTVWNRHLIVTADSFNKPIKIYKDGSDVYQLRTAGLPALASSPTVGGTAGSNSYLYAFCHIYTYQIEDQTFIDFGPVTQVQKSSIQSPDSATVAISAIPVLVNTSADNYDTTNIKIGIFRTINGGQEFYKVGEVTNATTTFNDTFSDTVIQDNESLYISGGVPDNDPPPASKYCHTVNGVTYYGYYKEGSEIYPNKIKQSQALDPDSVPASFEDELEDEITGLSSIQDIPIVGCKKHVYRIDGIFDELGRGGMSHRRISDHAGCISHESMVQAEGGLFWWGVDGIYHTDGFKCTKVTDHLTASYKEFVATLAGKNRKIKGIFDENTRMIHWTISMTSKSSGLEECDAIWTLDLQFGLSDSMTSHFWKGTSTFYPTCLAVHNGVLYRGDKTGYVLYFDEATTTDPKIDAGTAVSTWNNETIIWRYKSVASNFGSSFVRKIANKMLLTAKNETNVSVAISAINDDGKVHRDFTPIRWRRNFIWGDEEFVWGDPNFVWNYGGTIEIDRRFPAGGLRFNYLQIEITNDFTNIINSDAYGLVTVDAVANTATLVDAAGADWPAQAVDYYLYLEHDNYTKGYKVLARAADVLTLEDVSSALVDGNWKWQLKGYKKGEILNLIGYSISWASLSRSHDTFNTGDTGNLA